MANRKLGRTTDIRNAMLKTLTTDLFVYGKITTTEARAKEVKSIADSLIALAVKEKDNFETVDVKVVKAKLDSKGNKVVDTSNDIVELEEHSIEIKDGKTVDAKTGNMYQITNAKDKSLTFGGYNF